MGSNRRSNPSAQEVTSSIEFQELFDQHWISICRVLYRLLGDWDDAQDLALESFTQLALNPPSTHQNLAGWLYRVATRLGFNKIREQKRRRKYEQRASQETWSENPLMDPEAEAERKLEQAHVRRTLQAINPRSARLLLLRYSDLSYEQIANALDLAPGSVGTLLARGRERI